MKTFSKGGIHPNENKLTSKRKIESIPMPERVYIPTFQHKGTDAKAVVAVGDFVRKGQLIAEASSKISANVHSSVSGRVIGIENRLLYTGSRSDLIIIENDGDNTLDHGMGVARNIEMMTRDEIIRCIFDAGIVGMGGSSFPTHAKLLASERIDTLVINGAESEPYLTSDHRLMLEKPNDIVLGISLLMRATGATRALIGIESNKADAAAVIEDCIKNLRLAGIKIVLLKVKYPQGSEKQLIEALTGRKFLSLPSDINVLCHNIATCTSIFEACRFKKPLIERVVTVSGDGIENKCSVNVLIGTLFEHVVLSRGLKPNVKKIIAGGPMTGCAVEGLKQPVIKGTTAILALIKPDNPEIYPCIRCGRCVDICPAGLLPLELARNVECLNFGMFKELEKNACIECGSCSYVCPSKRPLVHLIKKGKNEFNS